jgi:hypothetical protein
MARRFIAGENPREALETVAQLRRRHMGFTLDILGEAVTSDAQADAYTQACLDLMEAIAPTVRSWAPDEQVDATADGLSPRLNLSVKLSSLDPNFSALLRALSARRARFLVVGAFAVTVHAEPRGQNMRTWKWESCPRSGRIRTRAGLTSFRRR